MTDQKNLIIALVLAMLVLIGWDRFVMQPQLAASRQAQAAREAALKAQSPSPAATPGAPAPAGPPFTPGVSASAAPAATLDRAAALAHGARLPIATPTFAGSINLTGGRIDDLTLTQYRETIEPNSRQIVLFSPAGAKSAYFAELGWLSSDRRVRLPDATTRWSASAPRLTPAQPVTLSWDNGQGLVFRIRYAVDRDYLFTMEQSVENRGGSAVPLNGYGLISRTGEPKHQKFFVLHEGPVGVLNGRLTEPNYKDVREEPKAATPTAGGWLGITDKYWLAALIPAQTLRFQGQFNYFPAGDRYQANYLLDAATLAPGRTLTQTTHLFAGAKQVSIIDRYKKQLNAVLFDRAIDWGWFWFLTKPIFEVLHALSRLFGNFGVAIIGLTLLVKLMMFPLANKGFATMNRMKELQPKIKEIQERYKDDKEAQQKAMIAIYQQEKLNPLGGCLPILLQMPVFFSLYKVLFVSIEMRHAPFFGWIRDLSAADPLTPVNLFGLLPFTPPAGLAIGVLPLIMGVTMYMQMKLNPTSPDPVQQKIFAFMPLVMTVVMAPFAAGLVLYWTTNNLLSILQQWVLMKRHVKPADA